MSLVDQIFEQAKLGTAPAPTNNPFLSGLQAGQHQQQLNMELAMMPLKQTLMQQKAALDSAEIAKFLQAQQVRVDAQQAISEYAPLAAKAMQADDMGELQKAQGLWWGVLSKHPLAGQDAEFMKYPALLGTSLNAKIEMEKNKELTDPEAKVITKDAQGNPLPMPITMARKSKTTWEPVQQTSTEITDPNGNVVRILTGPGGAEKTGLPPSVNAQLEDKLAATTRSSALLDESLNLISPENIGVRGKIGAAIETGANIIKPGSMPTPITKAQATFNTTAQSLYNSLKADSQINKLEAAKMGEIADITDWWEASATAKGKYQTLRDLTGLQSVLTSHKLGKITPDDLLKGMSLDFVNKYWKQKTITDAEMRRWVDLHGGNEAVEKMLLGQ